MQVSKLTTQSLLRLLKANDFLTKTAKLVPSRSNNAVCGDQIRKYAKGDTAECFNHPQPPHVLQLPEQADSVAQVRGSSPLSAWDRIVLIWFIILSMPAFAIVKSAMFSFVITAL